MNFKKVTLDNAVHGHEECYINLDNVTKMIPDYNCCCTTLYFNGDEEIVRIKQTSEEILGLEEK